MIRGDLDDALMVAEEALASGSLSRTARIGLHLEIARILDRIGLHHNTRPVAEALVHIARAERLLSEKTTDLRADVLLEKASYYYRAEMSDRQFPTAMRYAEAALDLSRKTGDKYHEADALHRIGLIHLQRRELAKARSSFDQSLEIERKAGPRGVMLGDYERHVGFLYQLGGDLEAALQYFERSLAYRRQAGLIDQSLFAAETLASTLVATGRAEEALAPALLALTIADKIDSPVGRARIGLVLGRLYERLGDSQAANEAYEMTRRAAESVGYESVVRQAAEAIARIGETME